MSAVAGESGARLRRLPMLCCALLAALSAACGGARVPAGAMVFAAASLTAVFEQLAREFERAHPGSNVELHFAGTPQLVVQLREGAPVDVFASADAANMARVVALGRTAAPPTVFARNRLVVVTAKGNPKGIAGLADLARAGLRVVLCGPEVPAGRYARQALARAGVDVTSCSDEPSVKAIVSKVALGEVDAGIVYVTDAAAAAADVAAVAIAADENVIGSYPIVLLDGGRDRAIGAAFVAFVTSPAGQDVLARFGFARP